MERMGHQVPEPFHSDGRNEAKVARLHRLCHWTIITHGSGTETPNFILPMGLSISHPVVPSLPPEIWLSIVRFLGDDDLTMLYGVNRLFYEVVMARRYREVNLVESNPRRLFKKISLLKNQEMSSSIQTLILWPDAVCKAISAAPSLNLESIPYSSYFSSPLPSPIVPRQKRKLIIFVIKKYLKRRKRQPPPKNEISSPPPVSDPEEVSMSSFGRTDAIRTVTSSFKNVRELKLKWDSRRSLNLDPCCPALATILPSIGTKLHSLSLDMPLNAVDPFSALSVITSLEELTINITSVPRVRRGFDSATRTAQLINRHCNTLRMLSLKTVDYIDLAPLFDDLAHFSRLEHLSLDIPLSVTQNPDSAGLNRLLATHSLLRKLVLIDCAFLRAFQMATVDALYDQIFHNVKFVALKEFEFGLDFPSFIHHPLAPSLLRSVSSLSIVRHCLTGVDARHLLEILPTNVVVLSVFLKDLSFEFFELLTERGTHITQLNIVADWLSLSEAAIRRWLVADRAREEERRNQDQDEHETRSSLRALNCRLQDIDIWHWEYERGRRRQWRLMRAIADALPSVRSFAGQGDMRIGPEDESSI